MAGELARKVAMKESILDLCLWIMHLVQRERTPSPAAQGREADGEVVLRARGEPREQAVPVRRVREGVLGQALARRARRPGARRRPRRLPPLPVRELRLQEQVGPTDLGNVIYAFI